MELPRLIAALSDSTAYPEPVETVDVRQTHISVVFLAGPWAYKIKKPVASGFVDYSTLERRRRYCDEEVRLNRRLAPDVYQGVVPVTSDRGSIRMEGNGEAIEWAVKMRRLPESATLRAQLATRSVSPEDMASLARRLARFHQESASGPEIAACCRFEAIAGIALENIDQAVPQLDRTLSQNTLERLRTQTKSALEELRATITTRAERGLPRDTHGDLRLEHVYRFDDRPPSDRWVIVDCIEFDARYRHADPIADIAFLAMELEMEGRGDLAEAFVEEYLRASGDAEGRAVLPFYRSYRAAVRGKVEGMKLDEPEIDQSERDEALKRARALWLHALAGLEPPERRPALILLAGLPGSGKSTLARGLADHAGFSVIRSDVVRKELASEADQSGESGAFGDGIYTPEWDDRTYAECLRRAEAILFDAGRVLIDASFRDESRRRQFLDTARRWGVASRMLRLRADPDVVRDRLRQRRDDASDAGWSIYLEAAARWEEPTESTREIIMEIDANGPSEQTLDRSLDVLRNAGLARVD